MRTGIMHIFTAIAACGSVGITGVSAAPSAAIASPVAARGGPAVSGPLAAGAELWAKRLAGGADITTGATAVAVSPAGDKVFVTGESDFGFATIAYQGATGAVLWVQRYHGPSKWTDTAAAMTVSPDGEMVYVTGTSVGTTPDYATIAYNARTGARIWVKRYNGPGTSVDTAFAIMVSPDGRTVIVTGGNGGIITDTDYVTIAYRAGTGGRIWLKRYDGPAGLDDAGISLAANPAGTKVFVTGTSWSAQTAYDIVTIAYRVSDGAQLWLNRYNGPGNGDDTGLSVAVSPSGASVFVTGKSAGAASADDYVTIAYRAATGDRRWVSRYNGAANGIDQANSLAVNRAGTTVYVTGHSAGRSSGADCATIAYNAATGGQRWAKRYNGMANGLDAGNAVVASPDGKVIYVAGTSRRRGTGLDYATIAYNPVTGARIWARFYNGPAKAADTAMAAAISPNGARVFVTGHSQGPSAGPDYATIAYTR